MARKSRLGQVLKLEEQIRELREKQKKIIDQAQKEIGEYLMEVWEVEDVEQAKKLIDKFLSEAKASFSKNESGINRGLPSDSNNHNNDLNGSTVL